MAKPRVVERFRRRTRWLHWIHTAAFLVLLVTGAILFLPGLGGAAAGGVTRIIHRVAVVFFVGVPLVYLVINPRMSWNFIKETFTWGHDDIKWLKNAPDYYFGGAQEKMPPQGRVNTGQKLWQAVVLVTGVLFIVSGFLMWFFKEAIGPAGFQLCLCIHDIAFVPAFFMLLVHIYLGALHPRMTESLRSMLNGKISVKYAKGHYGKWYKEKTSSSNKQSPD